jgi:hypothetical protein
VIATEAVKTVTAVLAHKAYRDAAAAAVPGLVREWCLAAATGPRSQPTPTQAVTLFHLWRRASHQAEPDYHTLADGLVRSAAPPVLGTREGALV